MAENFTILPNRCVISISGADRKSFLQGFITNDVNKISEKQAIYALMLNAQGRFLYDFFVIEKEDKLLLDCSMERVEEIIKKFSFYKLRSKIEIKKEENFLVVSGKFLVVSEDVVVSFVDPRNSEMGYRSIVAAYSFQHSKTSSRSMPGSGTTSRDPGLCQDDDILFDNVVLNDTFEYNIQRLNLKLPDDSDLTFDKSLPLEFGFDDLNAIDYKKGCYVGQETTARTHYKGIIRKKIFLIEIPDLEKIEKGSEIESGEKKYGEVLSSVFFENKLIALALIKNLDNEGEEINFKNLNLTVLGKEIKLIK